MNNKNLEKEKRERERVIKINGRDKEHDKRAYGSQRWNLAVPVLLNSVLLRNRSIVLLSAVIHYSIFKTGF